jgi:hypothetical protein
MQPKQETIVQMSIEHAFETINTFFTSRQAICQAFGALGQGMEIGVIIDHSLECTVYLDELNQKIIVERRPPHKPVVLFYLRPETIYVLADNTKDEIGDLAANVFKEVLAGNIEIKIPGQIMDKANLMQAFYALQKMPVVKSLQSLVQRILPK